MSNIKLFLFLFSIVISSYAKDGVVDSSANSNYMFDAYFFNEYELGYHLFSKDNSNLRISLGVNSYYGESDDVEKQEYIYSNERSLENSKRKYENSYHQINFRTQYLFCFYKSNLGESYFGIGSMLGYRFNNYSNSSSSNKNIINEPENFEDHENTKYSYSNSENSILLGVTALIGIRSYLTNSLSLFAETQINGYKTWSYGEHEGKENRNYGDGSIWESANFSKIDGNGWGYDFILIRVGLRFTI